MFASLLHAFSGDFSLFSNILPKGGAACGHRRRNLPKHPAQKAFSACGADNREAVYVDKTDLIYKLVTENSDKIIFTRPRRFGKSLLVSTLETLFKYGIRDFEGLAIEKLWKEKTYSVLHLDFSLICNFESHEEFADLFWTYAANEFSQLSSKKLSGESLIGINNQSTALNISNLLRGLEERSLVILIDEYDSPLTECADNPALFERIRKEMDVFFRMLKLRDSCLRLLFITGITKYRHTGLYSGFNAFKDCSMLPAYGTLLGYTEEELRACFRSSLQFASEAAHASPDDLVEQLKLFYDGYCFDYLASTHVFCPWSVLKFLDEPALGFRRPLEAPVRLSRQVCQSDHSDRRRLGTN